MKLKNILGTIGHDGRYLENQNIGGSGEMILETHSEGEFKPHVNLKQSDVGGE